MKIFNRPGISRILHFNEVLFDLVSYFYGLTEVN